MANANSTAIVRKSVEALKVSEHSWGKSYRGTGDAFIASGLIKPEWFPGLPGNAKHSVHIGMLDGEMKVIPYRSMPDRSRKAKTVIKFWKEGKRFAAYVDHPQEKTDRRELREKVERQHAEKKKELDALPKSEGEFMSTNSRIIGGMLDIVFTHYFLRHHGGYHYSREVIEKARDFMTDIVELAEEGKIYFDKTRCQHALDDIEEKHVKVNPEFSAFMASTLAIGKAATLE